MNFWKSVIRAGFGKPRKKTRTRTVYVRVAAHRKKRVKKKPSWWQKSVRRTSSRLQPIEKRAIKTEKSAAKKARSWWGWNDPKKHKRLPEPKTLDYRPAKIPKGFRAG